MKSIKYKLKAVLFDMDGVITNTMPDHYKAWKFVMKNEGLDVSYHDIYSREGQQGLQSVKEIFAHYKRDFNEGLGKKLLKHKEEYFKKIVKIRFVQGSRTILKNLKKQGFLLSLVTGTSRHEMKKILPSQISDLFNTIVTGNDVINGKPHPEPYLNALNLLKIKSTEAIVIENAPLGIQSAKQAGIRCLALETSLPRKYLHQADHVFTNFNQLQKKTELKLVGKQ